MINPNYQILWLLFVTVMADVHPSSGQINQYEQDMMIENDYKNTIAKTGLTGKRQPNRETTVSPGNRKRRAGQSQTRPHKCCAENCSFVWRPPLRTEGLSSSKEQSTLSGRKASATSRGRGHGCCGNGCLPRGRRN